MARCADQVFNRVGGLIDILIVPVIDGLIKCIAYAHNSCRIVDVITVKAHGVSSAVDLFMMHEYGDFCSGRGFRKILDHMVTQQGVFSYFRLFCRGWILLIKKLFW